MARTLFGVVVLAVVLAIGSFAQQTESSDDRPEVVAPDKVNRPMQILGAELRDPDALKNSPEITNIPNVRVLLENDYVRVLRIEVPPKGQLTTHWHRYDTIVLPIGEYQIDDLFMEAASRDFKKVDITLYKRLRGPQDSQQVNANRHGVLHSVNDTGWKGYRSVVVELKRESGHGNVVMRTVEPGAAVSMDELKKKPFVVVALDAQELLDETEGVAPVTLKQNTGEVQWYAPGKTHTFTNKGAKQVLLAFVRCD